MQLKRRNQSQTFLAKEIGIHRQTVVKWMNGETNQVTPDNVDRLASSLAGTDDQAITKEKLQKHYYGSAITQPYPLPLLWRGGGHSFS